MTINNLKPALELWDNGFNIIRINSNFYPPSPENPIFKPVEKREPVRELVLEEEEDDF